MKQELLEQIKEWRRQQEILEEMIETNVLTHSRDFSRVRFTNKKHLPEGSK